eukprot:1164294-Pyramimonas_sp.AAC.1
MSATWHGLMEAWPILRKLARAPTIPRTTAGGYPSQRRGPTKTPRATTTSLTSHGGLPQRTTDRQS